MEADIGVAERAREWDLPDPEEWAVTITRVVLEAIDGMRSPSALRAWLSLEVLERVQRRRAIAASRGQRPRPIQVRLAKAMYPSERVAEVSLVVHHDRRVRALALRLEGRDVRWVVTALELG